MESEGATLSPAMKDVLTKSVERTLSNATLEIAVDDDGLSFSLVNQAGVVLVRWPKTYPTPGSTIRISGLKCSLPHLLTFGDD